MRSSQPLGSPVGNSNLANFDSGNGPQASAWRMIVDLNELLKQHQIALIHVENGHDDAGSCGAGLVRHYAMRIADLRAALGVRQY